jgi:hypothetical protein
MKDVLDLIAFICFIFVIWFAMACGNQDMEKRVVVPVVKHVILGSPY